MSRVMIIGCGGVASVAIAKCCQNSDVFTEIMIASRTKSKCDAMKEKLQPTTKTVITTAQVDADNTEELIALINEYKPDAVLNVALPYQDLTIMDACLACGVNYIDTANYEPEDTDDPQWRAIYEKRCKEEGFSAYFDYSWQWAYRKKFEDAGLTYKPEMFTVFKEENDQIWKKIEQGILTMDDLPYVRWQAILKKLGLEADGVAMEMLFRKCLFYSAVPVEGAKEILDYLQGKYILCTASNGPYEQQICRLKKADMLKNFDHCFVSEKIGVDKPDVRFFQRCLEQLPGIRAEECMIVGDSLTADIAGGQAAGMETCWFCREKMEEAQLENVKRTHKADHVIRRLDELKDLL